MKQFNVTDFLNEPGKKTFYCQANVEEDMISYFEKLPNEWHRPAKDFFIHLCLSKIKERVWFIDLCQINEFLEKKLNQSLLDSGIIIEESEVFKEFKKKINEYEKDI